MILKKTIIIMYNFLTIGHDCSPAAALRNLNLRNFALPFDWVVSNINTIDACFKDNFKKFHTNLRLNGSQTRLIDEYGFEFPHDYPLDVDIDCSVEDVWVDEGKPITTNWKQYYPVVKAKYDRRIERFLKIVNDPMPIIILCRHSTRDVLQLREMLLNYYNKTNVYFVNSCNEQSYDKCIINCWTEQNEIWNETSLWKKALDEITYNLSYLDRMSSVTCVSGYWIINNKHSQDDFTKWFETTLRINCPYVFFGTKETIELAKKYRRELPTYYIELTIEEFYTYKYKDKMKTDPHHCPSVELNLIWNEKIFLIEKAKTLNIFNSEFFLWVDAGICSLRNEAPSTEKFPNLEKLSLLPTNKFIFTSSIYHIYEPEKLGSYYHFISGTAYLLHSSIIETVSTLYRSYMDKYLEPTNNIYTDQIILTLIFNDFPQFFHQIGHGYGELINILVPNEIHNFVICGVFKNESHILSEWIQHYLNRGVDHIYLVNDNSTDDYVTIIKRYSDKVTVFQNDIITRDVGRQTRIYDKYFRPLVTNTKWMAILDLDEFLYSPTGETFSNILSNYENVEQLKIDWLHYGSNNHKYQPISVVAGFTQRAEFSTKPEYYAYKCIFKTSSLISFGVHMNDVKGETLHLAYNDTSAPPLVINHYNLQSYDFFMNIKATRGDINNWFDTQKLIRDETLFKQYDINKVTDLRLFEQNKGKVSFDSSIGRNDDVTLIITSCNRPLLLDKTLESFVKMNTCPILITYLIDDSGVIGCNDTVVEKYSKSLNIISIYNPVNIGQVQSIDKVYSYVRTKWIFHCEEDWCFLKPNFIEKSMNVFNENPNEKIYTVWLRPHSSTSGHPIIKDDLNRGYYMMKKDFSYIDKGIKYTWGGITFNPGLRKTSDCLLFHPYSFCCEKIISNGKEYIGEYTINKAYVESGFYAMILAEPEGHLDHIGWNDHIKREWELEEKSKSEITFVTGLWDLNRGNMENTNNNHDWKRSFDKYKSQLKELLSTGLSIVIYGEKEIEELVSNYKNALFVNYPKDKFIKEFPFFNKIDAIRTSKEWYDQPDAVWLKSSPQAILPLYATISLNKIHFIQKTAILNPYSSSRFYWLDAGLTKNHDITLLRNMQPDLMKYNKFMFFSLRYTDNAEIHGFRRDGFYRYCGKPFVDRIMKGFFFGGNVDKINEIIELSNTILTKSLNEKLLGTEETIFSIMVYQRPDLFDKVMITDCANVTRFL